jgi:hypothetical protein
MWFCELKILTDYHEEEYISHFLMGLKEILSHIRGQILLLDPIPPINKVFSLILQEERTPNVCQGSPQKKKKKNYKKLKFYPKFYYFF